MRAARQPTACKYSRTGSPKRREPIASRSNFQTQPPSARLSERRPMNSTMKGLSQGCSGIRRKRAKAASKVSYTRLLPMGGRASGCRASSAGERIGESTITTPPSESPYWDATFKPEEMDGAMEALHLCEAVDLIQVVED